MKTKICSKCRKEKLLEEYNKHVRSLDGVQHYCRDCEKIRQQSRHALEKNERISSYLLKRENLEGEVWLPVVGYEGLYEISSLGRVCCLAWCRIMFLSSRSDSGKTVKLRHPDKKVKSWKVHRLVALAFIPNLLNKETVDHKNNNRADNNVLNLQWATRSEQIAWAYERGRDRKFGEESNCARLTNKQAAEIRHKYNNGQRYSDLQREYGLADSTMSALVKNKTYKTA